MANTIKIRFKLTILTMLFAICNLSGQQTVNNARGTTIVFKPNYQTQTFVLPISKDSLQIVFCYSIKYDEMLFQMLSDINSGKERYVATPVIEATFKDGTGIIRKRVLSNDSVFCDNYEETSSNISYSNFVSFNLPVEKYTISTTFQNGKSLRKSPITYDIMAKYDAPKKEIKHPNFLVPTVDNEYNPLYANTFIPFGTDKVTLLLPFPPYKNLKYKIEQKIGVPKTDMPKMWGDFVPISGECGQITNGAFSPTLLHKNVNIALEENKEDVKNNCVIIDISLFNFSPARYILSILDGKKVVDSVSFEVRWNTIPFTLISAKNAIERMRILLTDDEYKAMKKGNEEELFTHIINYWKPFDPTPATLYNEAMCVYFNRVDVANEKFQTIVEKDGAASDRGKVYLLNGTPNFVDIKTKDKIQYEEWRYNKIKKIYVFKYVSAGIIKLVEVKDL